MNKIGFVIQARTGSTRLPNKMLLPFYEELTILDILLERIKNQSFDFPIIVATSDRPKDTEIIKIAKRNNVLYYCGEEKDVLNRFIGAVNTFSLDSVIRICADNPFLSMNYLKQLVCKIKNTPSDYISFITKEGTPSIKTHFGFWTEYITVDALKRIQSLTSEELYHEHVTNYIYTHSDAFKLDFIPIDEFIEESGLRLTVDTKEDFQNAQIIYRRLIENKKSVEPENIIPFVSEEMKRNMKNQMLANSK